MNCYAIATYLGVITLAMSIWGVGGFEIKHDLFMALEIYVFFFLACEQITPFIFVIKSKWNFIYSQKNENANMKRDLIFECWNFKRDKVVTWI